MARHRVPSGRTTAVEATSGASERYAEQQQAQHTDERHGVVSAYTHINSDIHFSKLQRRSQA